MAEENRTEEHDRLKGREKVTSRDVPHLLETLACGDPEAQQETLRLLCPCRNVRYDREIWLAIFQAAEAGETGSVRDQAHHAIGTLYENARTDPRSQEVLRWLAENGVEIPVNRIPEWRPGGRGGLNGLYIPRYEAPSRSKANRRR